MHASTIAAAALLALGAAPAHDGRPPVDALGALAGTWDAEGGGAPGQGTGTVSFARELGGKAVIRRNVASYPAAEGRPATRHEDLLVVHAEGGATRALYVDDEGHVIRYTSTEAGPDRLVLVSDPGPGPRFRLTHDWSTAGVLRIAFEIAPPGSTAFKAYAEGRATRRP